MAREPAFLVTEPTTRPILTTCHSKDARSAMQRSVADYLETLVLKPPFDSRTDIKLKVVSDGWADPNDASVYPGASVFGVGTGSYENTNHPWLREEYRIPGTDIVVAATGELIQNYVVEVWLNDPNERIAWASCLEGACWPVDWMSGFRMMMPHYHGLPADFEPQNIDYLDSEPDDSRRYRKLRLTLKGCCEIAKAIHFPTMTVVNVGEVGPDVEVEE